MSLNTTPRTWVAGEIVTATEMNTEVRDALTGVQAVWASYTPAVTASTTAPTLGTGSSATGAFQRIGHNVWGNLNVTYGSSGVAAGSGRYMISLPVTANTNFVIVGSGFYTDASGPTVTPVTLRLATSTTAYMYYAQTAGTFGIGSAAPVVPAAGDSYDLQFDYQAA